MRLPAAATRSALVLTGFLTTVPAFPAPQLPVPCASGSCGTAAPGFVTYGAATAVQSGPKLTVTQTTPNAILNWHTFNIGAGGTVQFVQPGSTSVALNQIFQANPSQIFGMLTANGQVLLINSNGIIFGSTAQVNVGSLVASTLQPYQPQYLVQNGLTAPGILGQPAFSGPPTSGAITVQPGASIQSAPNGSILMFAPQVTNQGTLQAPGGQVMLAAGGEVYLQSSTDPNLRGLLVEVDLAGTVTNGSAGNASAASAAQLNGQIISSNGNITLAALAVNQLGRVSATTTVRENGSIVLKARAGTSGEGFATLGTGGTLTLGARSVTEVTLDTADTETTVDSVPQPRSEVQMTGGDVQILGDATVTATGGNIAVTASANQNIPIGTTGQSDGSRIYVAPGARLDASGASVEVPASSVVIPVQLRGTEFADFPLQRSGALRGQTVYVDSLLYGTRADGSTWVGTPIGDVSGEVAAIQRNVAERNLAGGTITLQSQGDVIVAPGALLDIAGGAIHYEAGYLNTSLLVNANGTLVDVSQADPNQLYAGVASPTISTTDPKWGVTTTTTAPGWGAGYNYQPAYTQGEDAGTVAIVGTRFVLDGTIDGQVTIGAYQRLPALPASEWPNANVSTPFTVLYRPYDEVPVSGTLVIGDAGNNVGGLPEFLTGDVTVSNSLVLPGLMAAGFNPTGTLPLPVSFTSSILRPGLLGPQGVGQLEINSDGRVTLPAGVQLEAPAGGTVSMTGNSLEVLGGIDAPGGSISLIAEATNANPANGGTLPQLEVGAGATLSARGEWVNDSVLLNPEGATAPLFIAGGSIALTAAGGDLTLGRGSVLDVSGGAQLTGTGTLVPGAGGAISVGVTPSEVGSEPVATTLVLDGTFKGYGLAEGGSLHLTADTVCIAARDCGGGDPTVLWVAPSAFRSGGFASYSIASSAGGLTVADGTVIAPLQLNFAQPAGLSGIASTASFESIVGGAAPIELPAQQRNPTNLTLGASIAATQFVPGSDVQQLPSLELGTGSVIETDPLAHVTLNSDTRIIVEGSIDAPGGSVAMSLNATLPLETFAPSQAIWLGPQSTINVAGVAQIVQGDNGVSSGSVLPGGEVTLTAQRGYLELLPGSVVDVSGTSATLNELQVVGGTMQIVPTQVASAGGSVNLSAAEGMALDGVFRAQPGSGAQRTPAGGSFSLTLDPTARLGTSDQIPFGNSLSNNARTILLTQTTTPYVVEPGSAVPSLLDGDAFVSADTLQSAGFDNLTFRAALLIGQTPDGNNLNVGGIVSLPQTLTLRAGESLQIDASGIALGAGAIATLAAPYVTIGNSDNLAADYQAATSGTGVLNVTAQQSLELFGTVALEGVGRANLVASDGDIRLTGIELQTGTIPTPQAPVGQFSVAGNLELEAAQIYPTTLTQFTLVSTAADGTIDIEKSGATPGSVWSAGGELTVQAQNILQNGVLRAPFGTLTLEGPTGASSSSVVLGAASLTSTSADGLVIPFGTTQGGFDWTYPLPNSTQFVYGTDGLAPPAQHITLQGSDVAINHGAVVDVSGGGDLLAYEFLPNTTTGGNKDVLASTTEFAVLPSLNSNVAPYDPNISSGSTLVAGASVWLAGAPGLPAGTYTLLPARYALLPGAFLVQPVSGYAGITPGQQFANPGGGTIVAGYNTVAGTGIADSQTSGFAVLPPSVFSLQATYTTTLANPFFSSQAQSAAVAPPRLPEDAGLLSLAASNQLSLAGSLRTAAPAGALGAEVDIASANIEVTSATGTTAPAPGVVQLSASSLQQLGAQSLLIGGQRNGTAITTDAASITIDGGVDLSAPELLLAATNTVTVSSGATLGASGAAPPPSNYTLSGDGAFLSISASPVGTVTRTNATGASGVLDLEAGSRIAAPGGSAYLDGGSVLANGQLAVTGGDLAVQSASISLGTPVTGFSTAGVTVLGSSFLDATALRSLLLSSGTGIDVWGSVAVDAANLTLNAAAISGHGGSTDSAVMRVAGALEISNTQGAVDATAGDGTGNLTLEAGTVQLGGGSVALSGFRTVSVSSLGAFSASADSELSTSGDLTVSTPRLTAASDVSLALAAGGNLELTAPAKAAALAPLTSLGGAIRLTGQAVTDATTVDLPAGQVLIASTGGATGSDVVLTPTAVIDVTGVTRNYDGVSITAPSGSVSLASAGNVSLSAGSVINVSASAGGDAGSLAVSAPTGTFTSNATLEGASAGGVGGSFSVDAYRLGGSFDALSQALGAAGFTGSRSVELRGPGDLVLASGSTLTATGVTLVADQGNVDVAGTINVSGASAGNVVLAAGTAAAPGNITLTGTIDARALGAGQSGGEVDLELGNAAGVLQFGTGAVIDVAGGPQAAGGGAGAGGVVLARVPRTTVAALASGGTGVAWQGNVVGARQTTLEAFQTYTNTTGTISASDEATSSPMYQDAATFMASAPQILGALRLSATQAANFVLEPGIEIDSTGSLSVSSPWNLYSWRFNGDGTPGSGVPGILTLRATGDITLDGSLSDGFATATAIGFGTTAARNEFTLLPTSSWSYRIIAGADGGSADVMAVDAATPGGVTIASNTMVRTGTGFIDVAASGDLTLTDQTSVLYTAGTPGPGIELPFNRLGTVRLGYPIGGGDISIDVDGDIVGAPSNQFVTPWLERVGVPDNQGIRSGAVAWTVNFQGFQQGVAALGGGNVQVSAGGDISDLSASIPSIGVQVGGTSFDASEVQIAGGGNLTVRAGGSIVGGSYYVGLGSGLIEAGRDIMGTAPDANGLGGDVAPVLGVGDAQFTVHAGGNLELGAIVNPTLVPQNTNNGPLTQSYITTYTNNSSVDLLAEGGNVTLLDNSAALMAEWTALPWSTQSDGQLSFEVLPPTLRAVALNGNITFGGLMGLFPAPKGNLTLLAQDNILSDPTSAGTIIVSDADPTLLPSVALPAFGLSAFEYLEQQQQEFSGQSSSTAIGTVSPHALVPIHSLANQPDGVPDLTPVRLVAATGDINFTGSGISGSSGIISPKPARVIAGQDIIDLGLVAQNLTPSDVTFVSAGRDITYPLSRFASGAILEDFEAISIDGPGALLIDSGRNFDLGTSTGITTRGNLVNPALPAQGASVTVNAGVGADPSAVSSFIAHFVDGSDEFDAQVVAYVEGITGKSNLTVTQAKQALDALPPDQQAAFMQAALAPQFAAVVSRYVDGSSAFDPQIIAYVEQLTGVSDLSASAARQLFHSLSAQDQDILAEQLVFAALQVYGSDAVKSGSNDYTQAFAALTTLFPGANPTLSSGQTDPYQGDMTLYFSRIYTLAGGDISLLSPGGGINVGLATPPSSFGIAKAPEQLGLVAEGAGDISALQYSDFQVNESRVFAADGGNILVWSTEGNIDAGRGAKTAISAPPPTITIGPNGQPIVTFPTVLTGSGIQTLATTPGTEPGNVYLFAPHGVVNANDAGIVANNLVIGATAVLGANNITVTGTAVGLPVVVTGLGASFSGASGSAGSASSAAEAAVAESSRGQGSTPAAEEALHWIDVFVIGLGEENCKAEDAECLKREHSRQ